MTSVWSFWFFAAIAASSPVLGPPGQIDSACVVDSGVPFAIGSLRVVAVGRLGRAEWSPDNEAVAFFMTPRNETVPEEIARLRQGNALKPNPEKQVVIYHFRSGKATQVGRSWNGEDENADKIGWIDSNTLAITTIRRVQPHEGVRVYLCDALTGAVVRTLDMSLPVAGIYCSQHGKGAQIISLDPSVSPAVFTIRPLDRNGLGEAALESTQIPLGGLPSSDGSGIVWKVGGEFTVIRILNGRAVKSPATEADKLMLSAAKPMRPLLAALAEIAPGAKRLSLRARKVSPLQPEELAMGLSEEVQYAMSEQRAGILYELNSIILARTIVELSGEAAERQLDQNELRILSGWADTVLGEFRSWTYGFTEPREASGFPFESMSSFGKFKQRLTWRGKQDGLFSLRGERLELTVLPDGKQITHRLSAHPSN